MPGIPLTDNFQSLYLLAPRNTNSEALARIREKKKKFESTLRKKYFIVYRKDVRLF